ncbi:MAG TPA: SWIB/MDM2 domain-containing protein [Gemmatimonadaceae bacterium]|nr:SWIB/MDM2 domain-containing protein [Gemmatimonadaceae bacterium]
MATSKKSAGSAKSTAKKAAPAKAAAKKAPAKGATKSAGAGKSAAKSARTPNAAFMKPMRPDSQLAAVVGSQPMPRSEITKRVWDYIKKNNLQDQQNKRNINADDKLRPVFGGKKTVTMFEMTKLVNGHLSEA